MAQKVSASVAEALKVDLHIRGSPMRNISRASTRLSPASSPRMVLCLQTGRCTAMTTGLGQPQARGRKLLHQRSLCGRQITLQT